jgi:predicted O-methyltransferase YrrM
MDHKLALSSDIEKYINGVSDPEDPVLHELYRETNLKILHPRMLSGPLQGQFLTMLTRMINPKNIVEIGTFTGYSAICMAKGLSENGKIHTIEINDECETISRKYFKKAGVEDKINLYIGDAINVIEHFDFEIDMVFIDGDKKEYVNYFEKIFPKVKQGGYIFADNVLWNNKVVEEVKRNDKSTQGILDFNNYIKEHTGVEKTLLPLRDGLFIIRKL